VPTDPEHSFGDDATFVGSVKRQRPEASIGDARTSGDAAASEDVVIDDSEVDDLAARYRIEGKLGSGGMGEVLLATDTRLERKVAIKRILGEAARRRSAINRFLTEAKSIAALNHTNIVQIYDYGRDKDGPFLIMEYVDASSLLDRCRDDAIPLEEAVDLACQLCDGLTKAHELGIIHRDIKPANVLLTKDGIPKLTDFGLAKVEAVDHGQTAPGIAMGTPDFMPPEQRKDASLVDARSDLWSLAATVYQMVTGRSPKIIRFKDVPLSLQDVLGKALEDAKEDRYQTVREFRDALRAVLRQPATVITSIGTGQCPDCGTQNDPTRKFCRGCGGSLEFSCLSCGKGIPQWEDICGQCGAKQEPLLEARRESMAAQQSQAENLLNDGKFAQAADIARSLQHEPHEKLRHLTSWSEQFLSRVESARVQQLTRVSEAYAEAIKHEQAYDYLSGIFTLEMIPDAFRSQPLPGLQESIATAIDRLKAKQAESLRLENRVKDRIASKQLSGLLPDLERLLTLLPDRADLVRLKSQLVDRQAKLIALRDTLIARATECFSQQDYEGAIALLSKIDPSAMTAEVTDLRTRTETTLKRVRELTAQTREAVAAKRFQGLLPSLDELLTLRPRDTDALKLRDSLLAWENKVASEITNANDKAHSLSRNAKFSEAAALLRKIPDEIRPPHVSHLLNHCNTLAGARSAAVEVLLRTAETGRTDDALPWTQYRQLIETHGIVDSEIDQLARRGVEASAARQTADAAALRNRVRTRYAIAVAAAIPVVAIVGGLALWGYSGYQDRALRQHIASEQWDEALAIDPTSSEALVGRAVARLTGPAKNIEGAFEDLRQAQQLQPVGGRFAFAQRLAFITRACDHAVHGRMQDAEADLAESRRWGDAADIPPMAQQAMATGWIAAAVADLEKNQIANVESYCRAAEKYGADRARLLELRAGALRIDAAAKSQQGDFAGALASLTKHNEIAPGRRLAAEEAAIRIALGTQAVRRSDAAQAAKELQVAVNLDKTVPGALQLASQLITSVSVMMKSDNQTGRLDDAVLILNATAPLTPEPPGTAALKQVTADALFTRVGELVSQGNLDAAVRDYENAMAIADRAEGPATVKQPLLSAMTSEFEATLRDKAYGKAFSLYRAIKRFDVAAGQRSKDSLASLPKSVIAQNPDIRTELESVVESFSDRTAKSFAHSGRQQQGLVGVMADTSGGSFFRLTSGIGLPAERNEPWALCFPSKCRVAEEVPIKISFRCRRNVLEPKGAATFLAIVIGSPTLAGDDAFESSTAPGRITVYNDLRLGHSEIASDYIGCENLDQKRSSAFVATPTGDEPGGWHAFEIMLKNTRQGVDTLLLSATVSSGGRQVITDFVLDAPIVGSSRKMFGCNVFFIVYGDPGSERTPQPGGATGCVYDLADVQIYPVHGVR